MTRSPTFSPAVETTTSPRTSGPVSPRPSPPGPTSPASPWLNNQAYRRASLNPSHFPSICTCQVDGAQAGLAAALPGGRADRSCERLPGLASTTGGGRLERRSAIEVTDDLTVFDSELTGLPGGFTVIPRGNAVMRRSTARYSTGRDGASPEVCRCRLLADRRETGVKPATSDLAAYSRQQRSILC